MEVAAKAGIPEAMSALGHMILARPRNPQETNLGLRWLRSAARAGVFSAPHNLGRAAENVGDWETAEKWYLRALDIGDFVSGNRLAWHYLDQLDTRHHRRGVQLLRRTIKKARAARTDVTEATIQLAKCYLQGLGVRKSATMGRRLLAEAARTDSNARSMLRRLDAATKRMKKASAPHASRKRLS
jgi:TPR repeat protein